MKWNEKSEGVYEANLSNVLVLRVIYYENHGWRGSIEGACNFPSGKSYVYCSDAMRITESYASGLLKSATNDLSE